MFESLACWFCFVVGPPSPVSSTVFLPFLALPCLVLSNVGIVSSRLWSCPVLSCVVLICLVPSHPVSCCLVSSRLLSATIACRIVMSCWNIASSGVDAGVKVFRWIEAAISGGGVSSRWEPMGALRPPVRKVAFEGGLYDKVSCPTVATTALALALVRGFFTLLLLQKSRHSNSKLFVPNYRHVVVKGPKKMRNDNILPTSSLSTCSCFRWLTYASDISRYRSYRSYR